MSQGVFTGVRSKWTKLYEELKSMTEQRLGAFSEHETGSAILWKHNSTFAEVSPKKDYMVIAFASDTVHDEWEPAKTLQTSKNRVAHYFAVTDDALFPALIERISQAYFLTKTDRAPKKTNEKLAYSTIEEYIDLFPDDIQIILKRIRRTIHEAAPDATQKISWQMPTFWQKENLIHFAVAKNHIGIYPGASGVAAFADKAKDYKTSKGAIQLPISQPIPYDLISEITRFRVKEVEGKNK